MKLPPLGPHLRLLSYPQQTLSKLDGEELVSTNLNQIAVTFQINTTNSHPPLLFSQYWQQLSSCEADSSLPDSGHPSCFDVYQTTYHRTRSLSLILTSLATLWTRMINCARKWTLTRSINTESIVQIGSMICTKKRSTVSAMISKHGSRWLL